MSRRLEWWPALIAVTALTACSLEPHYRRPEPAVAPRWPSGAAYDPAEKVPLPVLRYTDIFRDPKLQAIIAQALANNQNVRIALGNIAAARAQYRIQRSQQLPRINGSAGITAIRRATGVAATGGTTTGGATGITTLASGRTVTDYTLNAGLAAFEIDLFGRLRSLSRAALDSYLATEEAARAFHLTLIAEVATGYLTLAADRSLLAVAVDTETTARRALELTRARLNGGIAPRSDVRQAETILDQARSDYAAQTTLVAQDKNGLELLVGAPIADSVLPASIESVDGELVALPAGVDSRILLRRPDVVEAEYNLRAANARIGAARAAFFPTITLTGFAGLASTALTSLFTGGAFNFSAGPAATLPIFDGGALRGNLAFASAQADIAVAQYQLAVQTAFREVSDALARQGTIADQLTAQKDLVFAATDTSALVFARYREGIDPFLNTLDTQRTLYAARRSLAATRLTRANNLVTLYRTLGGDQLEPPSAVTERSATATTGQQR